MWRTALILCIAAIAIGAEAPPADVLQLPAGQEALRRYETACLEARQAYYHSILDADQRKITDLDRALKIAMNLNNLDEANRVNAAKNAAADALKEHQLALNDLTSSQQITAPEPGRSFDVFAHERWKTTITVKRGQRYRVTAQGQWSGGVDANKNRLVCGPEGMVIPDGDHQGEWDWYLEGRVNGKYPFAIGASGEFVAQEDGPLDLQMHDWWIYDNDGSIKALVQHVPTAEP